MDQSNVWWLLAGAAVAVELMTGTFYLLMFAVGFSAAAIAAYLGFEATGQMIIAASVGGAAMLAWRWRRSTNPAILPVNANRDVHLDIGEPVHVDHWNDDGTTTVKFRGAQWTAIPVRPDEPQSPGNFRIKEMLGNRLVIEKL